MSRYTGLARIRIHGPQGTGAGYVGLARKLLGEQMAIHVDAYDSSRGLASQSQISKTYTPKPTEQIQRKVSLPNGVGIRVQYNTFMPIIDIWVPEGVEPVKAIEYRGLLRALQDADAFCEPLVPPTGEPGEDGYNPGQVSELHPLYDSNNVDEQWLIYPDQGLSIEFNPYDNHPLPPRGGTFVMDMIAEPFDSRAFNVNGKPPLTDCKMLVTGGDAVESDEDNVVFADGIYTRNIPARKFRIGRIDELLGWPWADTRDPDQTFGRLVSLSAVMEHTPNVAPNAHKNKATFTLTFLKLNSEEGGSPIR